MPKRIELRRTKGWSLPMNAVSVARPSRWGNPYRIDDPRDTPPLSQDEALAAFRVYAELRLRAEPEWLAPLQGQDLACYCAPDQGCHADILLELANAPPPDRAE